MKVFLSSTAVDLVAYRQVADDTILRLSQQSVAMERFGPMPGSPVEECERLARECDVTVCIVAHRYGFEPEKGLGSITQREVEAAKGAGKAVLAWIVADAHSWTETKESDLLNDPAVVTDPQRVADVAAGVAALIDFKAWLRKTFVLDTFTTPDDLGRKIAIALSDYFRRHAPDAMSGRPKRGEVRIVHALQPAPHFQGRETLVKELTDWVDDPASPDRVWSLVAAGGTGKTAVVECVVREMQPAEANVLVWSFYERPDADAFLRECNQLFLGEEEGLASGRLERLERGLRDGRPHLIVLDGLERVQEDAVSGRVRGEVSDQTLRLLLRVLVAGLGRTRALVTSRFPLVDLQDWANRGYREVRLDDLTPEAGVAVLRAWGVAGDESELRAAALQVGNHALSVAVIGSYLRSFADGRIEAMQHFDLDGVTGNDPKAAKLARVLAFYAERLPGEERELMVRLSVFPRGVSLELLATLVDAGGEVAGLLVNARLRLVGLLKSLKARGLAFEYRNETDVAWTAHPFLREKFRDLLGCPVERVFDVVARSLGTGLEKRPRTSPTDPKLLDRYERLIEVTRLAGREKNAYELFSGMNKAGQLISQLGEYHRAYRILAAFSSTGRPEDLASTLPLHDRWLLAIDLAFYAHRLGRLQEVRSIMHVANTWAKRTGDSFTFINLSITSNLAFNLGRLVEARALATEALATETFTKADAKQRREWLFFTGTVSHALGDIPTARTEFAAATALGPKLLISLPATQAARHQLDLGRFAAARQIVEGGLKAALAKIVNDELAYLNALLVRIALAEASDPTPHLDQVRQWTSRTGEMECIVEAHLLASRCHVASGDLQTALGEAETGLLHAVACGYGLLRVELLVALARIQLAWPAPGRAIQAAREALDLATHPECQYAWGEADAAQVWGEAYFANHEPTLAHRAFTQALAVRKRIEHPGVADTEKWLAKAAV